MGHLDRCREGGAGVHTWDTWIGARREKVESFRHLSGVAGKVLPLSARQEGWKRWPQGAIRGQHGAGARGPGGQEAGARGRQHRAHIIWRGF